MKCLTYRLVWLSEHFGSPDRPIDAINNALQLPFHRLPTLGLLAVGLQNFLLALSARALRFAIQIVIYMSFIQNQLPASFSALSNASPPAFANASPPPQAQQAMAHGLGNRHNMVDSAMQMNVGAFRFQVRPCTHVSTFSPASRPNSPYNPSSDGFPS